MDNSGLTGVTCIANGHFLGEAGHYYLRLTFEENGI